MTRNTRSLFAGLALAAAQLAAHAHGFQLGAIAIGHPWARATVPGQPGGAGYLSLDNRGPAADRLLSARAAVAERVELHEMWMEGDVMRMRQRDAIAVPAGAKVEFRPGGAHLMLIGLKAPLKTGEKFPLVLTFEKAGTVEVVVNVEAAGGAEPGHAGMRH